MSETTDPGGASARPYGRLHEALIDKRFAVTFEVSPPRGASLKGVGRKARLLKGLVDAVNVTDGQGAVTRLASWAGCVGLMQEGVEPVMQLQCRDRNRIALQADLLGAGAVGVPNVSLMTGDGPRFGDDPSAAGVFDLDAVGLITLARQMRDEKRLHSGREISSAPRWLIGCVEDPFATDQTAAVERLARKVDAGAQYVQTQFVFDLEGFGRWLQQVRDRGLDQRCAILPGVGPIMSQHALRYLTEDLPGIHVPAEVRQRLEGLRDDRMQEEGLALCAATMEALRAMTGVAGVHILANGHEERLSELLRRAGIERPQDEDDASSSTDQRALRV